MAEEQLDSAATTSDDELVARLLARDQRAWRTFVERYQALIYFTIRRVLTQFSAHYLEPDEVYAALMAALLNHDMHKLRAYDSARGASLGSFLVLLTKHVAWDHLREGRRRTRLKDVFQGKSTLPDHVDTVDLMVSREQVARLRVAREELTVRDRAFLDLFVGGEGPLQIASRMGISVKTVYSKCHKVRARLQLALEQP